MKFPDLRSGEAIDEDPLPYGYVPDLRPDRNHFAFAHRFFSSDDDKLSPILMRRKKPKYDEISKRSQTHTEGVISLNMGAKCRLIKPPAPYAL
jgi:hypothetical protein